MDYVGPTPIDLYLGPQLIGTLINTVLYTVEVLLATVYFRSPRGKQERRGIGLSVMFNLIVDTVGSFAVCTSAYTFYVTFWGHTENISKTHWSLIVNIVTNAMTAFVVQGFLTYRFWKLSVSKTNENVHLPRRFPCLPTNTTICITIAIFCLMLFGWGGDIHLAIRASQPRRRQEDRLHDTRDVIMALAGTAAADLAITGALIWTLYETQTFNKLTKNLVRRIMTSAIITGSLTSVAASIVFITFLALPLSRVSTCFSLFLGRIYTLTMLYVLLYRDAISQGMRNVIVDSDTFQSTVESGQHRTIRRPYTSSQRTEEILFARPKVTNIFSLTPVHSAPDLHHELVPSRTLSHQSDTLSSHEPPRSTQ